MTQAHTQWIILRFKIKEVILWKILNAIEGKIKVNFLLKYHKTSFLIKIYNSIHFDKLMTDKSMNLIFRHLKTLILKYKGRIRLNS